MTLRFDININDIIKGLEEYKKEIEVDVQNGAEALAFLIYRGITDKVQKDLQSSRQIYLDNLHKPELQDGDWVITLDQKWLDDGSLGGPMDGLINSPKAKEGPNGKYIRVPFQMSKAPNAMTPTTQQVSLAIRAELKKKGIGYKTLEFDESGSPKIGVLHRLTFPGKKLKESHKHSPMEGVIIEQKKNDKGVVERNTFVIRTMSENNIWEHPGTKPNHFFESAFEDGVKKWNEEILPEILKKYENK